MSDNPEKYAEAANAANAKPKKEDRLDPNLTNEEVREIQAKARAKLEHDRHESAKKTFYEKELRRLELEEGLTGESGIYADMVSITIDLPEWAPSLNVNFRPYFHGSVHTVQRHVANSLAEMMSRAWEHEDRVILGKKLHDYYRKPHQTVLSPVGAKNVPRPMNG